MIMKKIVKGIPPRLLTTYKAQQGAVYDGPNFTKVKDKIREQLLIEQGFLCAYCMRRINVLEMKVEHFKCQDLHPRLQLDYNNLLGCCTGNEGQKPPYQICDTKKGNKDISFSPISAGFEQYICYGSSGRISSHEPIFDKQINDVLNLNLKRLVDNRKAALRGLKSVLDSRKGTRTVSELTNYRLKYNSKDKDGKYQEYIGLLTDYLDKKIKKTK